MKILGLDSSGLVAGIAVVEDDTLLAEYNVNYKKTHSQTLLPMLDEVRKMIELHMESVDAIAISSGPGSFTGLRIGAATAKGLGLALNIPLVEVPTLEGLAFNVWGNSGLICPIMDARRNQVYTGVYRFEANQTIPGIVKEQCAMDIQELLQELNSLSAQNDFCGVVFVGDGIPVYKEVIAEKLTIPYSFAPAGKNRQCASSIAALGAAYFAEGRLCSAMDHKPEYLRESQAERERANKCS